jgi:hypothetical protein
VYILDQQGETTVSPCFISRRKAEVNKYIKVQPDLVVTEIFMAEEPVQALATLKIHLSNIVKGSKCSHFKVVMSGPTNFRTELPGIQDYKGNRKGTKKPVHHEMLSNWLRSMPYAVITDNEEADDLLSRKCLEGHLIATIDKDLDNTHGWHYNFNKGEIYYVDETTAYRNFYKQMLTGDKADHIKGITGIGPVGAAERLDPCSTQQEMELAVWEVYKETFDNPYDAMVETGRLLWMRREEGEMWEPRYVDT